MPESETHEHEVVLPDGGTLDEARDQLLKKDRDAPLLRTVRRLGQDVAYVFDVPGKAKG